MRFSLRVKLFSAFIFIAAVMLGVVAFYIIDLFEKDKKTYIFDLNADIAINLSKEIETYLISSSDHIKIIADIIDAKLQNKNYDSNILKILFNQYEEIIDFYIYNDGNVVTQIYNSRVLEKAKINIEDLKKKIDEEPIPYDAIIKDEKVFVKNVTISPLMPSFLIAIPYNLNAYNKPSVLLAVLSTEVLLSWIDQSKSFEAYIVDSKGKILAHKDIKTVVNNKDISGIDIVSALLNKNTFAGTMEFTKEEGNFLGAYSYIKDYGLGVIVERQSKAAFVALKQLKDKIFFIVFYLFMLILPASIIFAKRLTNPLEELNKTASEIGRGNFSLNIKVQSNDEIGDLAGTFKDMAGRLDLREKELRSTYEKLVRSERMASCYLVGQKITSILDLQKVFDMSVKYSREIADAAISLLLMYDENTNTLSGTAGDGIAKADVKGFTYELEGKYNKNNLTSWQEEIENSSSLKDLLKDRFEMNNYMILPLTMFDRIYGILILINKLKGDFSKHDYTMIQMFAAQCAIACENARLYKEKESMAVRDGLTGLFNRYYFTERSKEEFKAISRSFRPLSYIILDIDHFKKINDTYGHPIGDAVLKDIAKILSGNIRATDIIFRYGGEEFAIMLTSTPKDSAILLAERLRKGVETSIFKYEDIIPVTISIGVSNIDDINRKDPDLDYLELLRCADKALYKAKENGRNRVEVYSKEI